VEIVRRLAPGGSAFSARSFFLPFFGFLGREDFNRPGAGDRALQQDLQARASRVLETLMREMEERLAQKGSETATGPTGGEVWD